MVVVDTESERIIFQILIIECIKCCGCTHLAAKEMTSRRSVKNEMSHKQSEEASGIKHRRGALLEGDKEFWKLLVSQ